MINAAYHWISNIPDESIPSNLSCLKDGETFRVTPDSHALSMMRDLGLCQDPGTEDSTIDWGNVLGCLSILQIYPEWEVKIADNFKEKSYIPGMFPITVPSSPSPDAPLGYTRVEPMNIDAVAELIYNSGDCRMIIQAEGLELEYLESDSKSEQIAIALVALAKYNQTTA